MTQTRFRALSLVALCAFVAFPLLAQGADLLPPWGPLTTSSGGASAAGGGGSGTVSPGTAPFVAYYTGATTVSSNTALQFPATEVVVNETGSATMDFRAEGDTNANLFFIDASTDRVGIGTATPAEFLEILRASDSALRVQATNTNGGTAARAEFAAVNDVGGFAQQILTSSTFVGGGVLAGFTANTFILNASSLVSGGIVLRTGDTVSPQPVTIQTNTINRFVVEGDGRVTVNETGTAAADFRVEGDTNANLLFVDASTDRVGIGTATPATLFAVRSTGFANAEVQGAGTANSGEFVVGNSTEATYIVSEIFGSTAAGTLMGYSHAGSAFIQAATLGTGANQNFYILSANDNTDIVFANGIINTPEKLRLKFGAGAIFNEDGGVTNDFRVEGDTRANLFFVDAGTDQVGINRTVTGATLDVDNLAVSESIFIARDNGTAVFTIANAGLVSIPSKNTTTSNSTLAIGDDTAMVTTFPRTRVLMGNTTAGTELLMGQDATHGLVLNWTFNATPASAYAALETYAGSNSLVLQSSGGRVGVGQTTPGAKLDVDNVAVAESIFIARDNGTAVFTIADGGAFTSTAGAIFSGVTTDIQATAGENLRMSATGAGAIEISSGTGTFNFLTSALAAGVRIDSTTTTGTFNGQTTAEIHTVGARSASQTAVTLGDTADHVSIFGSGGFRFITEQVISCAAGVATLDPQSAHITIDANGASCVVTIAETTAAAVPGLIYVIDVQDLGGAFVVTFPDVANIFDGPTLCTTTGLAENGTMQMIYANRANDLFVATACTNNL